MIDDSIQLIQVSVITAITGIRIVSSESSCGAAALRVAGDAIVGQLCQARHVLLLLCEGFDMRNKIDASGNILKSKKSFKKK